MKSTEIIENTVQESKVKSNTLFLNLMILPIVVIDFIYGEYYLVYTIVLYLTGINSLLGFYLKSKRFNTWSYLVLGFIILISFAVLIIKPADISFLLILFLFPLLAHQIRGHRQANVFSAILFLGIVVIFGLYFSDTKISDVGFNARFAIVYLWMYLSIGTLIGYFHKEKSKTDQELIISKRKFEILFNHLPIGVLMINRELKVLESNSKMKEWYPGLAQKQEYTCYNIMNPDDKTKQCVSCPVRKTFDEGKVYELEKRKITKEGETYKKLTTNPVYNEKNEIIAVLETLQDITKQKKYEKQLQDSQAQLSSLTDNSTAGIYMLQDDEVVYVNPALEKISDYTFEELRSMQFRDFFHPESKDQVVENLKDASAQQGKNAENSELIIQDRSGRKKWVQHSFSSVGLNGKNTIIGTINDITALKNVEDKLSSQLNAQKILTDISSDLVFADYKSFDHQMKLVLNKMNKLIGNDYSFVAEFSQSENTITNIFEWNEENTKSLKGFIYALKKDYGAVLSEIIQEKGYFSLQLLDHQNPSTKSILQLADRYNISEITILSLFIIGDKTGYMGFSSNNKPLEINLKLDDNSLKLLANIVSDSLVKYENIKSIESVNEMYDELAYKSRTITWELDVNGMFTYISPVVKEILNYDPDELVSKKYFYELIDEDARDSIVDLVSNKIVNNEPFEDYLSPTVSKNGQTVYLQTNAILVIDKNGKIKGIRGSGTDITFKKNMEDQLKESKRMYANLINNLPGFVFRCQFDENFTMIYLSKGFKDLLGLDPFEFIEKTREFTHYMQKDWINARWYTIQKSVLNNVDYSIEYPLVLDNESELWLNETGKPVFNAEDELLFIEGFISDVTERKKDEERRKKTEEKYRIIAENSSDVIWIYNVEKDSITYVSPSVYNLLGYTVSEYVFNSMRDLVEAGKKDDFNRIVQKAIIEYEKNPEDNNSNMLVFRQKRKKGDYVWVEASMKAQKNLDGEYEILGTSRDVNARIIMEESIKYQSDMQYLIMELTSRFIKLNAKNIKDILSVSINQIGEFFDADRCYFFQYDENRKNYKILADWLNPEIQDKGYPSFTVLEPKQFKWWFDNLDRDNQLTVKDVDILPIQANNEKQACYRLGIKSFICFAIKLNDRIGGFFCLNKVQSKKVWSQQQISGLQILSNILADVLGKYKSEIRLLKSEMENKKTAERFKAFIYSSNTGAWEYHSNEGFLWCSNEYYTMLGYSPNEFKNKKYQYNAKKLWRKLIYPEDYDKAVEYFEKYKKNPKGTYQQIFRMVHKNGNARYILSRGRFIISQTGENTGVMVGTHIDITGQKRYEETIKSKNKELESYLYVTSHDLRSPLVNIQGFNKRVEKQIEKVKDIIEKNSFEITVKDQIMQSLSEKIPNSLDFIQTNVKKMDRLINGLLEISRTGRMQMNIEKINMNLLIDRIFKAISYQIDNIGGALEHEELLHCWGDEDLLNQLFSNLIDNAIKYRNPEKKLKLQIVSFPRDGMVVYKVSDNGLGVDHHNQKKIWDVFYRVNPNYANGEGIGLNLVSKIVEKHYGEIWMQSEIGEGCTFYIKLPGQPFTAEK